ncbi:MAG: hypothetical protein J6C52_01850, partial [Clostridia bacterium]|nr:hypothetical protein [Clostridia bacterium]
MKSKLCFLLALLMLAGTACGEAGSAGADTTAASGDTTAAETEGYDYGGKDFGGHEFKVLNFETYCSTYMTL